MKLCDAKRWRQRQRQRQLQKINRYGKTGNKKRVTFFGNIAAKRVE